MSVREGVRGQATWAGTSSAPGLTWTSSSTPVAPTSARRGDRTAGLAGGQARAAAEQAAVSGPWRSVVRPPDEREQRGVDHSVPSIVLNGADGFAGIGPAKSKGFGIVKLSGHLTTPGTYEAPLGITLRELLDLSGGMRGGHALKFWTMRRLVGEMLTDEHLDVPLDFESVAAAGSQLGTRSVQIFDDTTCVVGAVLRWTGSTSTSRAGNARRAGEGTFWPWSMSWTGWNAGQGLRGRRRSSWTSATTSPAARSARSATARRPPSPPPSRYFQGRVHPAPQAGRLSVRPRRVDAMELNRMTVETTQDMMTVTIDGFEIVVPKGTWIIQAAELLGIADPAVLRPPAARTDRRLPPVPGRGGRPAQAAGLVYHRVRRRYGGAPPSSPPRSRRRRNSGVMKLLLINHPLDCPMCDKGGRCPCRTRRCPRARARPGSPRRSGPSPSRCRSLPRCCSTGSGASPALGAPGRRRDRRRRLHRLHGARPRPVHRHRRRASRSTPTRPAIPCRCAVGALTGAACQFRSRPFNSGIGAECVQCLRLRLWLVPTDVQRSRSHAG